MTIRIQRVESGALALVIAAIFVSFGYPWWALLAAFLIFDLSALGYLRGGPAAPVLYNLVHNYTAPALLVLVYVSGVVPAPWMWPVGLIAGCWAFHVAVDRALGFGLKSSEGFQHTHLGMIGKGRRGHRPGGSTEN